MTNQTLEALLEAARAAPSPQAALAICEDAVRRGDDGDPATVSDALAIDSVTRQRTREALLM